MKKYIIAFLTIIFCISLFIPNNICYANSALMQADSENEYFELLPIKDADISVASEVLTFDFTKETIMEYSPISQTTCVYDMRNAGNDKMVTMGFPLISTIDTFKNFSTDIKLGGQNIDFTPYYAFVEANEIVDLTFEEILEGLNGMERIDTTQIGYFYKIKFSDINKTDRIRVEFTMDSSSMVLHDYLSFSYKENTIDYSNYKVTLETSYLSDSNDKDYVYFYIIGNEATDIKVNALGDNSNVEDAYNLDVIETLQVSVVDYIISLEKNMTQAEIDIIASKLLEYQDSVVVITQESDLVSSIYHKKCLILLGYTVSLKGQNAPNMLSVSYPMDGAFSAYYKPTLYSYNYISNPAKNWASFGSFTINIYTNSDNPYVINTNLEFAKISENGYQYVSNGVPKSNISFSICASEKPKYDKKQGNISSKVWIQIVIWSIISLSLAGLIVSGIIIVVKKSKLKKSKEEDNGEDSEHNT